MRYLAATLIIFPIFFHSIRPQQNVPGDAVNGVMGDASFIAAFGVAPDASTDEALRIRTHLRHVEQMLREKPVQHLTADQQGSRKMLLDLLHEYWRRGEFPRNYDHPESRRSCFIDRDGNICAVGYLVEQTVGREVAEGINARFQYAPITDMDLPELAQWIETSGLTLEECAMIQPTYGGFYPVDEVDRGYAIASSIFSGANLSISGLNGIELLTQRQTVALPAIGLATGTAQLVYGCAMYLQPGHRFMATNAHRNVSMLNISVGTATVILSAFNLATHRDDRRTSWNLSGIPLNGDRSAVALAVTRRF